MVCCFVCVLSSGISLFSLCRFVAVPVGGFSQSFSGVNTLAEANQANPTVYITSLAKKQTKHARMAYGPGKKNNLKSPRRFAERKAIELIRKVMKDLKQCGSQRYIRKKNKKTWGKQKQNKKQKKKTY